MDALRIQSKETTLMAKALKVLLVEPDRGVVVLTDDNERWLVVWRDEGIVLEGPIDFDIRPGSIFKLFENTEDAITEAALNGGSFTIINPREKHGTPKVAT